MNYCQIVLDLSNKARNFDADILKNELLQIGCDSFVDISDNRFEAYCPENLFSEDSLSDVINNSNINYPSAVTYTVHLIKDENWNKVWEATSPSVLIGRFCHIRKSTQPYKDVKYDIIINPQQSFGTANHPTTYMIIEYLSHLNLTGKNVMDMGCGTAVLGILCKKMNAAYVEAIDIDEWAYKNAVDNASANNAELTIKLGGSEQIDNKHLFDIFLANINLNILLDNIVYYSNVIHKNGYLVLSGFYEDDIKELLDKTKQYGFTFYYKNVKDNWALLVLKKCN